MKRLLPAVVFLMVGSSAYAAPVLFDTREAFNAAIGEHALFTDFDLTHVPFTLDFEGDFGGLVSERGVRVDDGCDTRPQRRAFGGAGCRYGLHYKPTGARHRV